MSISTRALLSDGWYLLTVRQRVLYLVIVFVLLVAGTVEMAALSSAVPLVTLIIAPETLEENEIFLELFVLIGSPPLGDLVLWLGIAVCVLLVVGVSASLFAQFLTVWFGARVASRFAQNLFELCLNAPYAWFIRQNGTRLAQRLSTDSSSVGLVLYPATMEILYTFVVILIGSGIIVVTSSWESLVALAVISVSATCVLGAIRPRISRNAAAFREYSLESTRIGIDCVAGIKELKVKARQNYFQGLYRQTFSGMVRARTILTVLQLSVPALIVLIGQLGLVIVALGMYASGASTGEMSAFLALLMLMVARLVPAISRMFGTINKLASAVPYIEGYKQLSTELCSNRDEIDRERRLPSVPGDWGTLCLDDVSFAYHGTAARSLHNISIRIDRGGAYGIAGPSGAGKTTLVNLILGLLRPQTGAVTIDGRVLTEYTPVSWMRRIGYVPQSPFMINDTLRRNVALGVSDDQISDAKVERSLRFAGLGDVLRALDDGLDTRMGDRGVRLSGGQIQRVAIARALYDDPDILILDEATSALDTLTERALTTTIAALKGDITTVTIAHRLSAIERSDRIFVVDQGQLVGEGTYAELRERGGVFRAMSDAVEISQHTLAANS